MALDDDIRDLAGTVMLRDFEPEALRLIAFAAQLKHYDTGDTIFHLGDRADSGFLLRRGSVLLEGNGDSLVVAPPAFIGDTALVTETIRPAHATAQEPCDVLAIPRSLFLRALNEYPASAVKLHRSMAERLRLFTRELDRIRTDIDD